MGLFGSKKESSAIVIDIGSSSIGGACVLFKKGEPPLVAYTARVRSHSPEDPQSAASMAEALHGLVETLGAKGIPALHRAGGSHPEQIVVAVGTPWQDTLVETETIAPGKPFVFTKALLRTALEKRKNPGEGKVYLQKELIATLLNGYAISRPDGKRAERAEVIILSSTIETELMNHVRKAAQRFSGNNVLLLPFQSLAYEVLRAQYPHDREFILMRVSAEATSMLFGSRGLIIESAQVPIGLDALSPTYAGQEKPETAGAEQAWVAATTECFKNFATHYALPRLLFLVAEEESLHPLSRLLDTPEVHRLWLSDEPLRIIPVISHLLSSLIDHRGEGAPDVVLDLITLYTGLKLFGFRN
jgi:hypothetical protein